MCLANLQEICSKNVLFHPAELVKLFGGLFSILYQLTTDMIVIISINTEEWKFANLVMSRAMALFNWNIWLITRKKTVGVSRVLARTAENELNFSIIQKVAYFFENPIEKTSSEVLSQSWLLMFHMRMSNVNDKTSRVTLLISCYSN